MSRLPPRTYADLIGKPFRWGGRGPESFDCWGLVAQVLARTGKLVPDYPSSEDGSINAAVILDAMRSWQECAPKPGAAVVFKMNLAAATHVGVVIGRDEFLHVTVGTAVAIERLSSLLWVKRIVGFYEWPS